MSEPRKTDMTTEQERELIDILIQSNLYREMDLDEQRELLSFLATAYNQFPSE